MFTDLELKKLGRKQLILLLITAGIIWLLVTGCTSTRGLIIYRDGKPSVYAYETSQMPYVPGEWVAKAADGKTSASMGVDHSILGGVALGAIGAVTAATAGAPVPGM